MGGSPDSIRSCTGERVPRARNMRCHTFIDPEHYAASGDRTDAEEDLLDMVDDVANEYSRLCCQVEYAPGMDGASIQLQAAM